MTFAQFSAYVRYHTKTNSTTFTPADMLMLANIHKDELTKDILKTNEDYFCEAKTQDLVLNQREYQFAAEFAGQIKMIEAMIDGVNWRRLEQTEWNTGSYATDENSIKNAFAGSTKQYFQILNKAIWLLTGESISAVSGGLKIWTFTWPAAFTNMEAATEMDLSATDSAHGWPRQFQELLARRLIIDYKTARDKPMPLTQNEQKYEFDLNKAISSIQDQNLDNSFVAMVPYDTGENF